MMPNQHAHPVNGVDLTYFEWSSAEAPGPCLVFAHATGFHARVWDAIIERFPDRHCIAIDMRGHGRSQGEPITHWQVLADDVGELLAKLGIEGAVGIGHSMGAHALLQCAADQPSAFSRLVLFDPVILAPEFYADEAPLYSAENPHPASRRKRDFESAEAMIERFRSRDPYDIFDPRVFEDYCRHGLLPAEDGDGFELACSPEMEASVYASSRSNRSIHENARKVAAPTLVVRARQTGELDFKSSPTWPELASTIPDGKDLHRPDMTHFHPFQDPADAARIIREFIG